MKPILTFFALCLLPAFAEDKALLQWMDRIAQRQLAERAATIAAIHDKAAAQQRGQWARGKILELMGGLPDYKGPLNAKVTRKAAHGDYTIENILFESLPGIFVTGNLYRPNTEGIFPGILIPLGHWEEGKPSMQRMATNLCRKGFVVFVYDPLGQGERLQAYDARMGGSLAGQGTEQHFMAGAQSILVGQSFARYRLWDAIRALDYLVSRPEVNTDRIGATGCSGGGTLTTYISAIDPRVKVAAPLCYMQTFKTLFSGPVGDSEQSLPNFLSSGLDQADYVGMFAPKPWLIGSTQNDFFVPSSARQVYDEAKKTYSLYDAESKVKWVVGPGGHGTPLEIREAVYDWMIRWLKDGHGDTKETAVELVPDEALQVTANGQVATLPGGRDIYEVIRATPRQPGTQQEMLAQLRTWMKTEPGIEPEIQILEPKNTPAKAPAYLIVQNRPRIMEAAAELQQAGHRVAVVWPRGVKERTEGRFLSGDWITNTRAWLIGQNLPGMRAHDIQLALDKLKEPHVRAMASETAGVWLLMAAAVDPRISQLWLDRTPYSLRAALDSPIHRSLHDAALPGFVLKWDLADLVQAIAPRQVIWTDPTDWMRNVVHLAGDFVYRPSDATEPKTTPRAFVE